MRAEALAVTLSSQQPDPSRVPRFPTCVAVTNPPAMQDASLPRLDHLSGFAITAHSNYGTPIIMYIDT